MSQGLFIIGTGGHSKVILDSLLLLNSHIKIIFIDELSQKTSLLGFPIFKNIHDAKLAYPDYTEGIVAIGNNATRKRLSLEIQSYGIKLATVIHPYATVSKYSSIDSGCMVAAGSIIGPDCQIKEGCIVNTGCIIEHDAKINAFSHLGPGSIINAGCLIRESTWIKAGQIITLENSHD